MTKQLKPLDKWRLKNKTFALGSFVWTFLVEASKITLLLFILITCILFWQNLAVALFFKGFDIMKQVTEMLLIIGVALLILVIEKVRKLGVKKEA